MSIAGFYVMATQKLRLIPDFSGGGNLRTELEPAYEFYLLSADGRVYRDSGWGVVAARNLDRFDFDEARAREPQHVGVYSIDGDRVAIAMRDETIVATLLADGALRIGDATYRRTGFE